MRRIIFTREQFKWIKEHISEEKLEKLLRLVPDKLYVDNKYYHVLKEKMNWENPQKISEKIQWIKLYERNPDYIKYVDKYEAKKIVEKKLGSEYIIPTLGVWNKFDDIDFDKLPNSFVLKCTHDCGSRTTIEDKEKINTKDLKEEFNEYLKTNFYYRNREWLYKKIKPRIIAEPFMQDRDEYRLNDYKFHCFDGVPQRFVYVQYPKDEDEDQELFVYDRSCDYKHSNYYLDRFHYEDANLPEKKVIDEMLELAAKLSKGFPYVRIDFYYCNGQIYFGEYTFTSDAGYDRTTEKDGIYMGNFLDLKKVNKKQYKKISPTKWEKRYINNIKNTSFRFIKSSQLYKNIKKEIKEFDMSAYIKIRHDLKVAADENEEMRAHIPFPLNKGSISDVTLISSNHEPLKYPSQQEGQPTLYFKGNKEAKNEDTVFSVEYSLINTYKYIKLDYDKVMEQKQGNKEYLQEDKNSHIVFTDSLVSLANSLCKNESNPLKKARTIYNYITTNFEYKFMPPYATIDIIPEYCAIYKKGDCGCMALLFVTLLRIAGVPAKWQSGIDIKSSFSSEHNWASFYIEPYGWLNADLSYGTLAYLYKEEILWNFYFGNVDPYRIMINDKFAGDLYPPKKYERQDPFDNQYGEVEYVDSKIEESKIDFEYNILDIYER